MHSHGNAHKIGILFKHRGIEVDTVPLYRLFGLEVSMSVY